MSTDFDDALSRLATAIDEEQVDGVSAAAVDLREHVATGLAEVRLEPEDPLLDQRRQLHHRLEVIEAKAQAGRFGDADEDREEVEPLARELVEAIAARGPAGDEQSAWPTRDRTWVLAQREGRSRWRRALAVGVLALLVVGFAVQGRSGAARPLLALASLGGVLVAAGVLAEDARAGRLHLIVGHGTSRAGVVATKLAAVVGVLAAAFLLSLPAGALAGRALGAEADPVAAGIWGLGLTAVAAAFAALVAGLEARGLSAQDSLGAGVMAYLVLGPIWRSAFLAGAEGGDGWVSLGAEAVYLASPVAAGRHLLEVPEPGPVVAGLLVLLAWILVAATVAAVLAQRRGVVGDHGRA